MLKAPLSRLFFMLAITLIILIGITLPTIAAPTLTPNPENEHQAAVIQARQGDYEAALNRLRPLLKTYPEKLLFRYDYINILAWAGRDEEVLAQLPLIDFTHTPTYVLKAIGKSARNRTKPKLAITVYRLALQQNPRDEQALLGLVMSMAEAERPADANSHMATLLKSDSNSIELLETLAYIKEVDHNYAAAINTYDKILKIDPAHQRSIRGRVMALLRLKVPHEAMRIARSNPDAFTSYDWQLMAGDQAAREIHWGRLPIITLDETYRNTDSAIKLLQSQYKQIKDKSSSAALRNRFDLILAYRDRQFMKKSVALYEKLHKQGEKHFPPYALAAVGDAYLALQKPQKAITLLEQSVNKYSDNLDAKYSLLYAYLESGQYERSLTYIDRLLISLPQWTWPPGSKKRQFNPDRVYAQTVAAMTYAYVGKLDKAKHKLEAQLSLIPANTNVRNELGSVYLWRGWPRLASKEFRVVQALDPENRGASIGIVSALTAIGDYSSADASLEPLLLNYGDDIHVRNLSRDAEVRKMREIWIEVLGGSSSGNIYQGSNDLTFNAFYYDKAWKPGLRPFIHLSHRKANFQEQSINRKRLAAGIDYRQRDIILRASISDGDGSTGASLSGYWIPTDRWRSGLSLESFSEQTPLRADLTSVEAWSLEANTEYRFHESRSLGLSLQYMNFDDNNLRNALSAFGRQRLINGLHYRLNGEIYLYHQTNSANKTDYDYFNPLQQGSFGLSFNNEWLTYRHYEKSMHQNLVIGIGSSNQQEFDTNMTWSVSYEHHWNFSRQLSLSYGISRARPSYDGVQEFTTRGFLNLYTRF